MITEDYSEQENEMKPFETKKFPRNVKISESFFFRIVGLQTFCPVSFVLLL